MPAGAIDVKAFLDALKDEVRPAIHAVAVKAAFQFAAFVLDVSKQLCPVKTGYLVASGYVKPPTVEGNLIVVEIGYNAIYAAAVHEILTAMHAAPTGAKFLERAMVENAPKFAPFVIEKMQEALA